MREIKVAPSILSADFAAMGEAVERLETAGADLVHCDVMDGTFVPLITFGSHMVEALRPHTRLPLDVHLMTINPWEKAEEFARAGADILTVHAEACGDRLGEALRHIRSLGVKSGVAVSPHTLVESVLPYAEDFDMLLVMSVVPGRGGQKLIEDTLKKAEKARDFFAKHGIVRDIEMDGGITEENVSAVTAAGVNVIVGGSAVFRSSDMKRTIARLRGE